MKPSTALPRNVSMVQKVWKIDKKTTFKEEAAERQQIQKAELQNSNKGLT